MRFIYVVRARPEGLFVGIAMGSELSPPPVTNSSLGPETEISGHPQILSNHADEKASYS